MCRFIHKSQLKKDFKRLRSSGHHISVLAETILSFSKVDRFLNQYAITCYRVTGKITAGTWLLIYQLTENDLILIRTGSHSELL